MLLPIIIMSIALSVADEGDDEDDLQIHIAQSEDFKTVKEAGEELLRLVKKERENFTNCDEFLENAPELQVEKITNVNWKAFYFWAKNKDITDTSLLVNFNPAEITLVKRFENLLGKYVKEVNWTAAELYMETNSDFNGLLMGTGQSGLFRFVPSITYNGMNVTEELYPEKDNNKVEVVDVAMKFVEPHYLGLLNCEFRMLVALAPESEMPITEQKAQSVAAQFQFKGNLGTSYIEIEKMMKEERDKLPAIHAEIEEDQREIPSYEDPHSNGMNIF